MVSGNPVTAQAVFPCSRGRDRSVRLPSVLHCGITFYKLREVYRLLALL